jgi:hypothetical protein
MRVHERARRAQSRIIESNARFLRQTSMNRPMNNIYYHVDDAGNN